MSGGGGRCWAGRGCPGGGARPPRAPLESCTPPPILERQGIPALAALALAVIVSQATSERGDTRATVAACLVGVSVLALWRALARVGYRAPLVTVAGLLRSKRRRRWEEGAAAAAAEAAESAAAAADEQAGAGPSSLPPSDEEEGAGGRAGAATPLSARAAPLLLVSGAASPSRAGVDAFEADAEDPLPLPGDPETAGSSRRARGGAGGPTPPSALLRAAAARAARVERNRLLRVLELSALEARWWQWCAAMGVAAQAASSLLLAYDRLWAAPFDPEASDLPPTHAAVAATFASAALAWLGQTLLALSVPYELPPTGHLDDPAVAPARTAGPGMRVVVVLPAVDGYDIAEVAVP